MPTQYKFRAKIEDAGDGGAYVTVPFGVEKTFGKKRVKVVATIEGHPYHGSLVRMGTECHLLPVLKDIRRQAGKDFGDEIEVIVAEDTAPRQVEVPSDLQQALEASPEAQSFYQQLSYTHRREYVRWITGAKRDQTRRERIAKTIEKLLQGIRGHS
jgi:Bacteriocin-protection, YdeI or OmpD-Associated/Domain of unknown function (DUF1905)